MKSATTGWVLMEVMVAVVCLALMLGYVQRQQAGLDQTLNEILQAHARARQTELQTTIGRLFATTIAIDQPIDTVPKCDVCRGAPLHQVLRYEVNQW